MEQVFGLAGSLLQWKGAVNPLNDESLGYGFAEFESLEDAAQAVLVLNGLKLKEDGKPLVAKMDNRDNLKEVTEQQKSEAETIRDKVNFFIQNFSSTLTAPASTADKTGEGEDSESTNKKEENEEEAKSGEAKERYESQSNPKQTQAVKKTGDDGKNGIQNGFGYSEEITEEEIKEVVRLEPRPPDMADEIWDDIVGFRNMQARHEILNDRKRKETLLREVQRLRDEREKERLEREKEEQEKLAKAEAEKQKPKEDVVEEKKVEPEVIDYSLKKDMSFGK